MIRWPWTNRRKERERENELLDETVDDVQANNEQLREGLAAFENAEHNLAWEPPGLSNSNQPYRHSYEHLLEELTRIDYLLWLRVEQWRAEMGETAGKSGGYYIPDEKVDRLLRPGVNASGDPVSHGALYEEQFEYVDRLTEHIGKRKELTRERGTELRLVTLAERFGLDRPALDVLLVAAAPEFDSKYETVYGYLHDNITRNRPTVDLVLRMFSPRAVTRLVDREVFARTAPLRRNRIIRLSDGAETALSTRAIVVDERIVDYLLGNDAIDDSLSEYVEVKEPGWQPQTVLNGPERSDESRPNGRLDRLVLDRDISTQLENISEEYGSEGKTAVTPLMAHFYGPYGSGRLAAAAALTAESGRKAENGRELLIADVHGLVTNGMREAVELLVREARLRGADVAISNLESLDDGTDADVTFLLQVLDEFDGRVYLFGDESLKTSQRHNLTHHRFVGVHFAIPSYERRKELWNTIDELPDDVNIPDLAGKFRLTAGQIEDAVETAKSRAYGSKLTAEDVYAGCRAQSREKLGTLGRVVDPNYEWADIVLPDDTELHLREVAAHIKYQGRVYRDWGFEEKFSLGNGVIALFTGPSGTGKTMAAEIIANDAGLDLYKIDLSSVVSKYIGETEKNLSEVFDEAENSNAILFFDEADALFGKRSEVSDAHDRYANIEVNYLLQRVEEHDGAVILTTNFEGNIDDAFLRRIHLSVDFPRPDEEAREQIWREIFPKEKTPRGELDYEFLSQFELTGGNIKNIALTAAFMAAENDGAVEMEHVVRGVRREFQKAGKLIRPEQFEKYRDPLEPSI